MKPSNLRELTILSYQGEEIKEGKELVYRFKGFIEAYCAELKKTENDVLYNDETYDVVLSLFKNVLKHSPEFSLSV